MKIRKKYIQCSECKGTAFIESGFYDNLHGTLTCYACGNKESCYEEDETPGGIPEGYVKESALPEQADNSDLVHRLRTRATIRRQLLSRKSVQEGKPDRIADLLEEAANEIERLKEFEWMYKDLND